MFVHFPNISALDFDYVVKKYFFPDLEQYTEYCIAGMYMGELVRQVLVDLMKDDLIFVGANREKILERGSFYTRFASEIESDPVGEYAR